MATDSTPTSTATATVTPTPTPTPIRKLDVFLDRLPDFVSVDVPSVGFDFGTAFVRAAVVYRRHKHAASDAAAVDAGAGAGVGVGVSLSTFAKADAAAALRYAAARLDDSNSNPNPNPNELKVYFTGRATPDDEQLIKHTFPNASSVERRDKLACHARGAHFLVSSDAPEHELYHDTSEADAITKQMIAYRDKLKYVMPPKMQEVMSNVKKSLDAREGVKFPLTLTLTGTNVLLYSVDAKASYEIIDVRSDGVYSMEKFWKVVCPEGCQSDFESFLQLATKGDRRGVDSLIREITEAVGFYDVLPKDFPCFNFGKMEKVLRQQVKPEDLARGLLCWHTDLMIMKSNDLALLSKAYPIYFCGSLVQLDIVRSEILQRAHITAYSGLKVPQFLKTDATAALGACCNNIEQ